MRRWIGLLVIFALMAAALGTYVMLQRTGPVVLKAAAGPRGEDMFALLGELAEVVERNTDAVRIEIVETSGASENVTLVQSGAVSLATIEADTPAVASTRLVANLFPDYYTLIARADSGITSVEDMRSKRIAVPPFGTSGLRAFWTMAGHYRVEVDAVSWQAVPSSAAIERMVRGDVDAMFLVASPRDRVVAKLIEEMELTRGGDLRFIDIDQAAAIALRRPFVSDGLIVKGTYRGQPPLPSRAVPTVAVGRLLVASADADVAAMRELTRVLFEQRLDLTIRAPIASFISAPSAEQGVTIPIHPGAQAFYDRDKPSFLEEYAEVMALMVTLVGLLGSALFGLRARFSAGQKNRIDAYNKQLVELAQRSRQASTVTEVRACRTALTDILIQVVDDLDVDVVTMEGFQSFSLTWEAVRDIIADRTADLDTRARVDDNAGVRQIAQ